MECGVARGSVVKLSLHMPLSEGRSCADSRAGGACFVLRVSESHMDLEADNSRGDARRLKLDDFVVKGHREVLPRILSGG